MDLMELYKVASLMDIKGNEAAVRQLAEFGAEVRAKKLPKPVLLHGPPGTGKTASVHILAESLGWNLIELNASDYRDSDTVKRILISSATSGSLFGTRNVILLDEVDELSAKFDKSAGPAIVSLLETSRNPIIFIANDMWDRSISFLRNRTVPVAFKKIPVQTLAGILLGLCKKHGIAMQEDMAYAIAARNDGDARSAISDMFVVANGPEGIMEVVGMRDKKRDIFAVLDRIFMANTLTSSMRAATSADMESEMLLNWLEENVHRRYSSPKDLSHAISNLSEASKYLSRANRSHYYSYLRYTSALMSGGVSLVKENYPSTSERYAFPRVIKSLSSSKEERGSGALIAKKLQRSINSSVKDIRRTELALIAKMLHRLEAEGSGAMDEAYDFFMQKYGLTQGEVSWIASNYA